MKDSIDAAAAATGQRAPDENGKTDLPPIEAPEDAGIPHDDGTLHSDGTGYA
ncbi:hypothetical protein [Rhizobium lentis]|uniref:hypothetical protein n=1 Tax=Rhizobium lentis TaxID=1138194 RepID=UPI001C8304EE|nr:hypothetical protein [Rhizobium lentis]MBX4989566.1 hypothetical protein [Rhizobium lentis]